MLLEKEGHPTEVNLASIQANYFSQQVWYYAQHTTRIKLSVSRLHSAMIQDIWSSSGANCDDTNEWRCFASARRPQQASCNMVAPGAMFFQIGMEKWQA